MIKLLLFLPSLVFVCLWLHVVSASIDFKASLESEIHSDQFIYGVAKAFDDPWLHNLAMRLYFRKLLDIDAPQDIWSGSELFARSIWLEYQYAGALEILIIIAHSKNNLIEEKYLANIFQSAFPGKYATRLSEHARIGHALGNPLPIRGGF